MLDDLTRARDGFVLASDLHLVYLVTPTNVDVEPDWDLYYERFMELSALDQVNLLLSLLWLSILMLSSSPFLEAKILHLSMIWQVLCCLTCRVVSTLPCTTNHIMYSVVCETNFPFVLPDVYACVSRIAGFEVSTKHIQPNYEGHRCIISVWCCFLCL